MFIKIEPGKNGFQEHGISAGRGISNDFRYEIISCPAELFAEMISAFRRAQILGLVAAEFDNGGVVQGPQNSEIARPGNSKDARTFEVFDSFHRSNFLRSSVASFARASVTPSVWYGPRVYRTSATLSPHVDRPVTHALGASLHLESDLNQRWPISLEVGKCVNHVYLKNGEILLYEGADLVHYRLEPLPGRFYVGVFFHYQLQMEM